MPKKVIVLLAEGFEEVEAITPIDYLRRAGIGVTTASVGKFADGKDAAVKGARGVPVIADAVLTDLAKQGRTGPAAWDAVVIPGGMPGASNLAASKETGELLTQMAAAGKWVAAICASPAVVLAPLGLLAGKRFTCYPGMEAQVSGAKNTDAQWAEGPVVIDGNLITSRGAGTAAAFAIAIIGKLAGEDAAKKVARSVLLS